MTTINNLEFNLEPKRETPHREDAFCPLPRPPV